MPVALVAAGFEAGALAVVVVAAAGCGPSGGGGGAVACPLLPAAPGRAGSLGMPAGLVVAGAVVVAAVAGGAGGAPALSTGTELDACPSPCVS